MRIAFRRCLLASLAALLWVTPALAQADRRASLTVKIALDPSIGGTVLSSGNAIVAGNPAAITQTKWTDSHSKNSPLFAADVGYGVSPALEVLGGFEYGRASADLVTIGSVPSGALSASFDAYQFWGIEGGVRLGAPRHGGYALVTGGFRRISDLNAILTAPGVGTNKAFYDGSAVPSFGFGGGYLFASGAGFGLGLEVDVKYAGSLKPAAASPELASVNNTGSRWSLPVAIVLKF
jgi:hypothetical protein